MVASQYTRILSGRMKNLYVDALAEYRPHMADRPEDLTVDGGLGKHSLWIATMSGVRSVTKRIAE